MFPAEAYFTKVRPQGLDLPRCRTLSQSTECFSLTQKAERLGCTQPLQNRPESAKSRVSWTVNKRQTEHNLLIMSIFFVSSKALLIKNAPKLCLINHSCKQCWVFLLTVLSCSQQLLFWIHPPSILLFLRFIAGDLKQISTAVCCSACFLPGWHLSPFLPFRCICHF